MLTSLKKGIIINKISLEIEALRSEKPDEDHYIIKQRWCKFPSYIFFILTFKFLISPTPKKSGGLQCLFHHMRDSQQLLPDLRRGGLGESDPEFEHPDRAFQEPERGECWKCLKN